jgi:ribosomal protein L37E
MSQGLRADRPAASRAGATEWVHICERCGERMEERKCKIICGNCGFARDCSDP